MPTSSRSAQLCPLQQAQGILRLGLALSGGGIALFGRKAGLSKLEKMSVTGSRVTELAIRSPVREGRVRGASVLLPAE